jgi:hypothetical protein
VYECVSNAVNGEERDGEGASRDALLACSIICHSVRQWLEERHLKGSSRFSQHRNSQ